MLLLRVCECDASRVLVHNIKATIMTPCLSLIKTARRPYPNTQHTPRSLALAVAGWLAGNSSGCENI